MSQGALPGFRDFYPAELAERAHIFATWRDVARRFGFVEYDGPPLEPLELYTKKSGDEIVGQLYNFVDKGEREVALRPEMTPTFARMVAARANALRKPVRWFSIPQLFRYERQQRGRLREHFQLNMDIVGEADVTADAELLAAAIDIMRQLGLGPDDVRARVSDRRILHGYLQASGVPDAAIPDVLAVVDKIDRQPRTVSEEKLAALGLATKAVRAVMDIPEHRSLDAIKALLETRSGRVVDDFIRFAKYVEALGGGDYLQPDLSIVRGLAYYTGIVFELFDAKGELRAICGGGRYDTLLAQSGGPDLPALGFGMGDVVLGELLRERSKSGGDTTGLDCWIVTLGGDVPSIGDAMRAASTMRTAGLGVEYALRPQSTDKQLKAARSAGARFAVILRPGIDDMHSSPELQDLLKHQKPIPMKSLDDCITRIKGLSPGGAQPSFG
ncbi:MAG TPA: histidine--tRNA ligase [Gemmatimonadaceae bacterium]|jgi:histidyl-tRNA synthetase